MHLAIETGRITDTHTLSMRIGVYIVTNVLAGALRDFKILMLLEKIVCVQKRMADQRRPDDCGNALRQVKSSRLIIEVVSPTSAAVSLRLIINEPLEGKLGL